ncbi:MULTISPECIES: tripartite tricarboxylate transporter TctB family protein [Ralstonia]|uniref:DUF1468 domain-containing protein n=1 Tax=Ralstonia flaminis TaxID=3058597 RepID=A0ABN9JL13_9RALS|nr:MULTISPECIES: tripartite tricarboxylate transporter TctB family protein [unclassified Ralstonia]CAJ0811543.1 hypothetical protein LMG18101_01272 [Ralstonia sp. LMG 18101]
MQNDPQRRPVIRSHQDFASGVMFIVAGTAFAVLARGYRMGTTASMGPGYFPFWLGIVLVLLGVVVVVQSLSRKGVADRIPRWDIKTLLWILGSVVLFGLLLQPLGLVFSVVALVMISSLASHEFGWRGALATAIVMVIIGWGTFVWLLNLQLAMWPAFVS